MTIKKERPILFSGEMVRAILEGRKTQTRRIVKNQGLIKLSPNDGKTPMIDVNNMTEANWKKVHKELPPSFGHLYFCPYGKVGDRLWVREKHCFAKGNGIQVRYAADGQPMQTFYPDQPVDGKIKWVPSIHMKRQNSRLTLEITNVRVERLQDISNSDILDEGITAASPYEKQFHDDQPSLKRQWQYLWESINGAESWAKNPWVWVVEFKVVKS